MFEAKLRVRLESGEPKCANCKWWDKFVGAPTMGACTYPGEGARLPSERACTEGGLRLMSVAIYPHTTDLTLCSAWKGKD